jgi:hypothetical protein
MSGFFFTGNYPFRKSNHGYPRPLDLLFSPHYYLIHDAPWNTAKALHQEFEQRGLHRKDKNSNGASLRKQ